MAEWLDEPIGWLRAHFFSLLPVMAVAVALTMMPTLATQVLTSLSFDRSDGLGLLLTGLSSAGLVLVILLAPAVLPLCIFVSMTELEDRGAVPLRALLRRSTDRALVSTACAGALIQACMFILALATCGFGATFWLVLVLYIPLAIPIAAREGTVWFQSHLRSATLVSWKPRGGPWYGSTDRVVVALHVVAGVGIALAAVPQLPLALHLVPRLQELLTSSSLDLQVVQQALTPPLWVSLPTLITTSAASVVTRFYSARLFLDLHSDLVEAREGGALAHQLAALSGDPQRP